MRNRKLGGKRMGQDGEDGGGRRGRGKEGKGYYFMYVKERSSILRLASFDISMGIY